MEAKDYLRKIEYACDDIASVSRDIERYAEKLCKYYDFEEDDRPLTSEIYRLLDEVGNEPGDYGSVKQRAWELKHRLKERGVAA